MISLRRHDAVLAALVMTAVLALSGCTATQTPPGAVRHSSASPVTSLTPSPSAASSPAPHEALVRTFVTPDVDAYGWVQALAGLILSTYYPPGQRYLGGILVPPTDEIVVVKMHGEFQHSVPPNLDPSVPVSPENDGRATLALMFYNATTGQRIPFSQLWDGNAPDLGVGAGPGIADREMAAQRWDLRLLGTPTVRTI